MDEIGLRSVSRLSTLPRASKGKGLLKWVYMLDYYLLMINLSLFTQESLLRLQTSFFQGSPNPTEDLIVRVSWW